MLQKLMLAVTMTFVLNLFLSSHLPTNNQTGTYLVIEEDKVDPKNWSQPNNAV